jgi:hypothetical protein
MHGNMGCLDTCVVPKWNNKVPKIWPWDHNIIGEGLSLSKRENIYLLDFTSIANILV